MIGSNIWVLDPKVHQPISVLPKDSFAHNRTRYSRQELAALLNKGAALNCSLWDALGIGFAEPPRTQTATTERFVDAVQSYWVLVAPDKSNGTFWSSIINGTGPIDPNAVERAIRAVVVDATRVLARVAGDELQLATSDVTKTVAGAVLDLSVTLVGVVAMASGRADVQNWFLHALRRRPAWLAQALAHVRGCVAWPRHGPCIHRGERGARP
jgi:hypothetical protein